MTLVELLATLLSPAGIIAAIVLFQRAERRRATDKFRSRNMAAILPNRLQAYERLALYMERITPETMLIREQMKVNTAYDLHTLLITAIRQEFEHNIAMQIYISSDTWGKILRAREEVMKCLNNAAKETNPQASSLELARKVLERAPNECNFYVKRALEGIRQDIAGVFAQ